ncbi:hypothetical protein C0580_00305 [Candidatus Parcubacteria bacterium]|nr:MAG: hypothetical protein C0580_00305 [Candidatus Parcubacteria bacterium]
MSLGFNKKLIDSVVCQKDNSELEIDSIDSEDDEVIFSGHLKCKECGEMYQINNGILNMLSGQSGLPDIMKDEIEARDREAESYDERLSTRYQKEVPSTIKALGKLKGSRVIEYGCGTGRITEMIVAKADLVLANDFSLNSLRFLAKKLSDKKNVGLVLADSVQLKTRENYFDISCSFQFLEHVPTSGQRNNFITNNFSTLVDGGVSVSSVYHFDLRRQKNNLSKEGTHNSGIFFHYFDSQEIEDEFKKTFSQVKVWPIDITLPLEARIKLPARLAGIISRLSEKILYINKFGHLLLVKAKK